MIVRLGGRTLLHPTVDSLRGDTLAFESPRGVAVATRFLVEALPKRLPGRILCGMDTEGAVALAARALAPEATVTWFHMDAYVTAKVRGVFAQNGADDIDVHVGADLPEGPFDLVALAFPASSESQLMWDLLEAAHDALAPGGRLVAATDGKPDALRAGVKKVFRNVTPAAFGRRAGASFFGLRRREAPVLSDRTHVGRAVIRPADGSASISLDLETRPGTFAYRAFDAGTRALAEAWTPPQSAVAGAMGEHGVLDLGAGCGGLGITAALRLGGAHVTLVDSNARALGCAQRNAARMGVADRVEGLVRADFEDLPEGAFDIVLANPPFFGDSRIARSFTGAARRCLRPGGTAHFVAKAGQPGDALADALRETFGGVESTERGGYSIVSVTI